MAERDLSESDTRTLRFLKGLVTVLTLTMIAGVIAVTTLLVIRLQRPAAATLPETVRLPDGVSATAFTQGVDWFAVVTDDDRILIYDRAGTLSQTVEILGQGTR